MQLCLIQYGSPEYQEMVALRYEHLRKPLGLFFTPQELEKEKEDFLLGVFLNKKLIGCCTLSPSVSLLKLRQMAIDLKHQRSGIGKALLHFAEKTAIENGYRTILLHARETAVDFYSKSGYAIVDGPFEEVTIPHYKMEKKL